MGIRCVLIAVAFALCLGLQGSTAKAADGEVSDGVLGSMGLGGMQSMTDVQGEQVRGKFLYSPAYIAYVQGVYTKLYGATAGTRIANQLTAVNNYYYTVFPNGYNGYGTTPGAGPYIIKYKGL